MPDRRFLSLVQSHTTSKRGRKAFSLVELLVTVAVVGILVALAVPALQYGREAARQNACQNNLRQIGVALQNFHDARRQFPTGRDAYQQRNHSWATAILPYLEQAELFARYDYQHAWDDDSPDVFNREVARAHLAIYQCPTTLHELPSESDYGGNYGSTLTGLPAGFGRGHAWDAGVLISSHVARLHQIARVRFADLLDGAGHTLLVVENAGFAVGVGGDWANGHRCVAHDRGPINSDRSLEIFSDHPGGAHGLLCDGSVQFLSEQLELATLGALCTRAGGELYQQTVFVD